MFHYEDIACFSSFPQAVCKPFEVQVLLSVDDWTNKAASLSDRLVSWPGSRTTGRGQSPQSSAYSPPARVEADSVETVLTAVMGNLSATADASQVAALLVTLENITTEAKAEFDSPAMSWGDYLVEVANDAGPPGPYSVSLEVPEACMVAISSAREDLQLADSPYFAAPLGGPVQLLLGAPCVRLGLQGKPNPEHGQGEVYLSMISPLAWAAPNLGVYIPLADICLGCKRLPGEGSLACKTGAVLPTPRVAARGSELDSSKPEWGTQLPHDAPVCLTLSEIQVEMRPAAESGPTALADGATAAMPPLQIFVAAGNAAANFCLSRAEYLACSALTTALGTSLLRHDPQHPVYRSASVKSLHLHLSLTTLQASLECSNEALLQRSSSGKSSLQGSNITASYEQRAYKVCFRVKSSFSPR